MVHIGNVTSKQINSISFKVQDICKDEKPKEKIEEAYNPFEHRDVQRPISDARALANLLKSSLGSGIFAMPLAFSCAGLVVGTLGTIIIGFICTHCSKILVRQSQIICTLMREPSLGYGETCEQTFIYGPKPVRKYARFVRLSTDFAMAFSYLGVCCVYVVLMASSIKQLLEYHIKEIEFEESFYSLMLLIPLLALVQINNLKFLAPISAIANLLLIAVCGISFYFILDEVPSFEDRALFVDIRKLPLFLSTVVFSMEGIGIVMPIENEMVNPSHFLGCPGVLNISMSIVVLLYTTLGFFGYVKYGSGALGSITLNFDMDLILAKIVKGFIIFAIYFTYPLQYYIFSGIMWKYLKPVVHSDYQKLMRILFISLGVAVTIGIAALLPKIDAIIELVGSVFYSTLGLLIPAFIEIVFQWNRDLGFCKWKLWKNTAIMIFAFVTLVCGVIHSINLILS